MLLKEKNIKDLTIQIFHSCIAVSDIINNKLVIKRYIGYSEKEAVSLFINEFHSKKTSTKLNDYFIENQNVLFNNN